MDNIQLALLLNAYKDNLINAVDNVRDLLPEEKEFKTKKSVFGQEYFVVPVLNPIYDFIGCLEKDIELLKEDKC